MALLAVVMCVNFAACSDNDEEKAESDNLTEIIVGAWAQDGDDDIFVINTNGTGVVYEDETLFKNDEDGNPLAVASYNQYGDYVLDRPNSEKEEPIYGLAVNYTVNAFPEETYIDSINTEFQKFLDRGVNVYFTYSPRNKFALSEESTKAERDQLHAYLKSHLIVPVISALEDSLYPGTYLYGTDNHLSTEGVQIRTEKVIRDLKAQLAKEEKN